MLTDDPPRTIGQHVSGQRLIWGHPTLWAFISESSFTDCDITIACSARAIGIKDCVFRGCTIRTKRPLTNFQFFDVVFDECRFIGRYPGCEFGFRSPGYEDTHARGYVRRCDFARAQLSLVTINSSEVATLTLPPWPHFALLGSSAFSEVPALATDSQWQLLASLPWPAERTALVHRYVHGGRHGFSLPEQDALAALAGSRSIRIERAAQQRDAPDEGS